MKGRFITKTSIKYQQANLIFKHFLVLNVIFLLSGCFGLLTYNSQPLTEPLEIKPINDIALLSVPKLPEPEQKAYRFTYESHPTSPVPRKDFTGSIIKGDVKNKLRSKPSVLIGLPKDVNKYDTAQNNIAFDDSDKSYNLFSSKGDVNSYEPLIEKALLFVGFDVRDRAKFEAILRDKRDQEQRNGRLRERYDDDLTTEALALIDNLKLRLKNKEISNENFQSESKKIRENPDNFRTSVGEKRNENDQEMIDTSEMIRAATGSADYLLLVHELAAKPIRDVKIDLTQNHNYLEVKEAFALNVPANELIHLPKRLNAPGYQTKFSAKLINVSTGSIEWIGDYSVGSSEIYKFDVVLGYTKVLTNKENVENEISGFNKQVELRSKDLKTAEWNYKQAYQASLQSREFESEAMKDSHESQIKRNLTNSKAQYIQVFNRYLELNNERDNLTGSNILKWTFDYKFSDPYVEPDIETLNNKENAEEFERHILELLEKTITGLIDTIEVVAD